MKLALGLHSKNLPPKACVATIGNFDGVHLGHRAVITRLVECGKTMSLPVCVVLFEPQPREFFDPEGAPPRLMRVREKIDRLAELPIDYVVILRFNQTIAKLSPEAFIKNVLVDALQVRHLVIGDDFRFGYRRMGDFALLQREGAKFGFSLEDTPSVTMDGLRISSTLIREALTQGSPEEAARLLGKPYEVCGRVIHGQKRGRTIGFPTANVLMQRKNPPVKGVFAVTMRGFGPKPIPGVANVGVRPTVSGDNTFLLETHLMDFSGDLYGHKVEVEFHTKLRDEQQFNNLSELQKQIEKDIESTRRYFASETKDPSPDHER